MATYAYEDFHITMTARADGQHDLVAAGPDGRTLRSTFTVPLSFAELEQAVVEMARDRSRAAHDPVVHREVAQAAARTVDAQHLGRMLADALFAGDVGTAYDAAREKTAARGCGLRLTLSLVGAPALLSLPWEFLYRRPRFLASQRHTPLVRRLHTGTLTAPPAITSTVRILGVVASPKDLSQLDVAAERRRVEAAVEKMRAAGRVQLDWLEPASPRLLREALRDNSYHILHYVGHSSFTTADEGAIYLTGDDGTSVEVDNTMFANLLSDQNSLRLVVLNSCEGARTTLSDPYAGVATTLIDLGVPAVVAMQFEISDRAAILFAEELYTNLIGRQDPIDAAVAEARKAIYVEIDKVEWATPVLFVRDPDVQLFDFKVPVAPLPPPPPPEMRRKEPIESPTPPPPPPRPFPVRAAAGLGAVVLVAVGAIVLPRLWSDEPATTATTTPATSPATATDPPTTPLIDTATTAQPVLVPRPRTGVLSVQVREAGGDTHLYPIELSSGSIGVITDRPGVTDTEAVWDRATNRVAFTRVRPSAGEGSGIYYVVPGNFAGDDGKQVAPLVPWSAGEFEHDPAWTADGLLLYARTVGCAPGPGCAEEVRIASFTATDDGSGFLDALTPVAGSDRVVVSRFVHVSAVIASPIAPDLAVVADADGLWLVTQTASPQLFAPEVDPLTITYTPDGGFVIAVVDSPKGQLFHVYTGTGDLVAVEPPVGADPDVRFVSLTPDSSGTTLLALSVSARDESVAVLSRLGLIDDGRVGVVEVLPIVTLPDLGAAQAIAL